MNNQVNAVLEQVELFNESIKDALNTKRISNTGEAARSLRTEFGEDFVRSLGVFYLEFLDTGRGSGKFPPYQPIANWVSLKLGITPSDSQFDGVVYMIRKKIAALGTEIFRNNNKGIELDKKIVTLRKAINESVAKSVVIDIKQKLDKFKKIYKMSL